MKPWELIQADCRAVLACIPDNSVDAVVTDPPYHLTSIVKRFGAANAAPAGFGTDGAFSRASRGFMGQEWDGGDIAFNPALWAEVLRVLKPGGHMVAFSGTRTYHRMACAIEDSGFEIRDQIAWVYGSGFPKSHDVSKAMDAAAGVPRDVIKSGAATTDAARQWQGWGTALKPAFEPICLARKPLDGTVAANVLAHGVQD
jgi:DNA modification methylase